MYCERIDPRVLGKLKENEEDEEYLYIGLFAGVADKDFEQIQARKVIYA